MQFASPKPSKPVRWCDGSNSCLGSVGSAVFGAGCRNHDNAVVRPGSTVTFQIEVDPTYLPAEVDIDGKGVATTLQGGPSYSGDITIPPRISGPIRLGIALIRPGGGGLIPGGVARITLNVIPDEAPLSLDVNDLITLSVPGGRFGSTRKVSVTGIYPNGVERDLDSHPMLGTTYSSSDTGVVTVDSNGNVQAVGVGYAYITVENQGVREYVAVQVNGANESAPPPVDVTSRFAVAKGGFRFDSKTHRYIQQVTLRNATSEPVFHPLIAVISDLPDGVRLENSRARSKVIAPLGSGTVVVKFPDVSPKREYLNPGESAKVMLEFTNRDGVPLNYQFRVYQGVRM